MPQTAVMYWLMRMKRGEFQNSGATYWRAY